MLTIVLESLGPFASRYEVEVKPLTLLIGRNSVGKSVLAYLAWVLAAASPDPGTLFEVFDEEGGRSQALEVLRSLEERKPLRAREALEEALRLLAGKALPRALARSLGELLPRVYGRGLEGIVTRGHRRAVIGVRNGAGEGFFFTLDAEKRRVSGEATERMAEYMLGVMEPLISVDEEKGVLMVGEETWSAERIRTLADLYGELAGLLGSMVALAFEAPVFATREYAALLVDSRAGVLRTLPRPFTAMLSEAPFPDQAFIAYYYMLAERLAGSTDALRRARSFTEELGFELELRMEGGVYNIYARMWSGETLPIALAPSGVRESVALVTALTTPGPPSLIVVEEPEAHLHPRAQVLLADLMAEAASRNKWIVATTHSDYIVYEVNNQVIASTRQQGGLGPDRLAAYLVHREGGEAVIEPISIGPEGIPEDEFAQVAEELAARRGMLTAQRR